MKIGGVRVAQEVSPTSFLKRFCNYTGMGTGIGVSLPGSGASECQPRTLQCGGWYGARGRTLSAPAGKVRSGLA